MLLAFITLIAACGGGADDTPGTVPTLSVQPADQSVTEGSVASFSVAATGTEALQYAWSSSVDGRTFTPVAGATAAVLRIGPTTLDQTATSYRVVVSNSVGSATSSAATLTVTRRIVAPAISVQPADQSVNAPAAVHFDVTATGTSPAYQWQESADAGASFSPVAGAPDQPTLTLASTAVSQDGHLFRVLISNAAGSVASVPASLHVAPTPVAPAFTTQPVAQAIVAGQAASFTVGVSGEPMPAVRWELAAIRVVDGVQAGGVCAGTSAAGARTATLTLSGVAVACSGVSVVAFASNGVGDEVASSAASLVVHPAPVAPTVTLQPADASVPAPSTATFNATAAGVPTPIVQWQQSLDGGATWANVTGATNPSYTTPATALADSGRRLRAVFSNASGSVFSQSAALTVTSATPVLSLLAGDIGGIGNFDGRGSAARFTQPGGIAVDAVGNAYVADSGSNLIRRITPAGQVTTLAGSGLYGSVDGNGRRAAFAGPQAVAVDSTGTVYVADTGASTIRKLASDGTVSTLAGLASAAGNVDGTGAVARFDSPLGIAVGPAGVVYVADTGNRSIRAIGPGGVVSTLVGASNFFGSASLAGLAVDATGVVYVADRTNNAIFRVQPGGSVAQVAATVVASDGTRSAAVFDAPWGVSLDAAGNLYVVEQRGDTVRRIASDGTTTTLAGTSGQRGTADGPGSSALFFGPRGIAADASGTLRVADSSNHTIRSIGAAGAVTTLAGLPENTGAVDGLGATARFGALVGLAVDPSGNLFVNDPKSFAIRKITPAGSVTTFAGALGRNGVGDPSDDGVGGAARFAGATAITSDAAGTLYVGESNRIRKIDPDATVTEFAGDAYYFGFGDGTGSAARFTNIQSLAADAAGTLYAGDDSTVRTVTPTERVATLAGVGGQYGNVDGSGHSARFGFVAGVAVDKSGSVSLIDGGNLTIRRVSPAGDVTTLAGSPNAVASVDGAGSGASFVAPTAIAADSVGNLYVADFCSIRKVTASGVVTTVLGVPGDCGIRLGTDARIASSFGIVVLGPKRLALVSHDALLIADLP